MTSIDYLSLITNSFPSFLLPFLTLLLVIGLGWVEAKNRQRLEELAERLRLLYKRTGQPALRIRRPRKLHFETHRAIRELEKSLSILERHHQIQGRRRRAPRMFIDNLNPVFDDMEKRIVRLEEIAVEK